MLTAGQLEAYLKRLKVSDEGRSVIHAVRAKTPARSVDDSRGSSGFIVSPKMGSSVQFRSAIPEAAAIYQMEEDDDVLEYWDQPYGGLIVPQTVGSATRRQHLSPALLVLRRQRVDYEDWMREESLMRLATKDPARYVRLGHGRWEAPERAAAAEALSIGYRLRSAAELNPVLVRNIEHLEDYRKVERPVAPASDAAVREAVTESPGLTLTELFEAGPSRAFNVDDVNALLVWCRIYVDLRAAPLVETDKVRVYPSREYARALGVVIASAAQAAPLPTRVVNLSSGSWLTWDGRQCRIAMAGDEKTWLEIVGDAGLQEFPTIWLKELIRRGAVKMAREADPPLALANQARVLQETPPNLLEIMLRRVTAVKEYGRGCRDADLLGFSVRQVQRFRRQMDAVEDGSGRGCFAVIPRYRDRGRRVLPSKARDFMTTWIARRFKRPEKPVLRRVYRKFRAHCLSLGFREEEIPHEATFAKAVREQNQFRQVAAREGSAVAYQLGEDLQPGAFSAEQVWWLEYGTPRHGDRPFHRVYADHTQLDLWCIDSKTGLLLGRPWLSLLLDGYSRRVLALILTFERPSYRTVMRLLRVCVKRFGRLPQWLVVDRGKEFQSIYLRSLAAAYRVNLFHRPARRPRTGDVIERIFGTLNVKVVYKLLGNTQASKRVRSMTREVDPQRLAAESLLSATDKLMNWAYRTYDADIHTTLGVCPQQAFDDGIRIAGARDHLLIPYDEEFQILTMPAPPRGSGTVIQGRGIKLHHLWYKSPVLTQRPLWGRKLKLRYDPDDIGHIWALIRGEWVECSLKGRPEVLRGLSERELSQAIDLVKGRMRAINRQKEIDEVEVIRAAGMLKEDPDFVEEQRRQSQQREALAVHEAAVDPDALDPLPAPTVLAPHGARKEARRRHRRDPAAPRAASGADTVLVGQADRGHPNGFDGCNGESERDAHPVELEDY